MAGGLAGIRAQLTAARHARSGTLAARDVQMTYISHGDLEIVTGGGKWVVYTEAEAAIAKLAGSHVVKAIDPLGKVQHRVYHRSVLDVLRHRWP